MGLIAALMLLGGVVLSFLAMRTADAFTISGFIFSPGFFLILLGLVMYHVSGRARKKEKKERRERGY